MADMPNPALPLDGKALTHSKQSPFDIEFTNILNKEKDSATCNLLRVGDIKILLDCGCDERLSDADEHNDNSSLMRVVKAAQDDINYIFISHATI